MPAPVPVSEDAPASPSNWSPWALATLYTVTILVSSTLLFLVQPLFAKMVLPLLGGAPAVWTVSLFFFQTALLAGYAYAHALRTWLPPRRAAIVHLGLMAAALLTLPISVPRGWEPPPGEPALWQLGLFTVAIGLPFTLLSANAPLLQAWFARSGHPRAAEPYFLYAASNLGSLIALLGYPFVLEPAFGVSVLAQSWTVLFVLLLALIGLAGYAVRQAALDAPSSASDPATAEAAAPVTWAVRARWAWLAAIPSALLTAFTAHIATDLASAPLIWVLPLALYLATFVVVFRDQSLLPLPLITALHVLAVALALMQLTQTVWETALVGAGVGGLAFVAGTLAAHRALYDTRPAALHLTEFYVWLSAGGALGGLFAALVAPRIFNEVYEYPLLLALTLTCNPRIMTSAGLGSAAVGRLALGTAAGFALIYWVPWAITRSGFSTGMFGITFWTAAVFAAVLIGAYTFPRVRATAALLLGLTIILLPSNVNRGDATRSFFGVYRVKESWSGEFNYLSHGTTLHGAQRVKNDKGEFVLDTTPATYYHPKSPMAQSVVIQRDAVKAKGRALRVGVVGLGTGSLPCYAAEGETWRVFEIDPAVVKIASNPVWFSFLDSCRPSPAIVIGDARLTLAKEPDGAFDLLIVDAFSSDAVPVHLLTREAMVLYLSKLSPEGVAVLHISNRYLDLDGVVAATLGSIAGADGTLVVDNDDPAEDGYSNSLSTVAVIATTPGPVDAYRALSQAEALDAGMASAWTDDHSDVLGAILRRVRWKFW